MNFSNLLQQYMGKGFLIPLLTSYGGGLLTSLTPCFYPLIPLLVAYVGGRGERSKGRGFVLSSFFVLGLSVTYSALGAIASLTGMMFGQIQSSPWTYLVVGNIILFLGLSMLGLYEFRLPQFLQGKKSGQGKKRFFGAFLLGLTSGFIAAPCTAPVLGTLLTYVASRQRVVFGTLLLFVYSLGMGTLLIVLGTFTGFLTALPKSGKWMVVIKKGMGWVMLAMAEYFLIQAGRFWV